MTGNWNTRRTLVQRAKDPNDQHAWDEFVRYYKPFIEVTLRRLTHRASEHDDLVQETLVMIWKSLSDFEFKPQPGSFRRWLSTLMRNRVIDLVRKNNSYESRKENAAEQKLIEDELSRPEFEADIEREWERHITQAALSNIKQVFSGTAVTVFELTLKGRTAAEIAAELSINQDSVRTLKNRVKQRVIQEVKRLRSELEF